MTWLVISGIADTKVELNSEEEKNRKHYSK